MVTSVTMVRKMGSFDVEQRTKDGYFNANALLSQWNANPNNPERRMARFIESPKTSEFVSAIEEDTHSAEVYLGSKPAFYEKKSRNTSKGRTSGEVWMHP